MCLCGTHTGAFRFRFFGHGVAGDRRFYKGANNDGGRRGTMAMGTVKVDDSGYVTRLQQVFKLCGTGAVLPNYGTIIACCFLIRVGIFMANTMIALFFERAYTEAVMVCWCFLPTYHS